MPSYIEKISLDNLKLPLYTPKSTTIFRSDIIYCKCSCCNSLKQNLYKCYNIISKSIDIDIIIDSLLIITIHIFFISIFEPLFYLNYVTILESDFIKSKIQDEYDNEYDSDNISKKNI